MSKLADLSARQAQLKADMAANAKDALGEAFVLFFKGNPTVTAIRWRQYTPYFNDGDVCEFGVHDFEFCEVRLTEEVLETSEDEEPWTSTWEADSPAKKAVKALEDLCDAEVLEAAFGDHVTIVATPEGFAVTSYEHD